MSDATQQQQRYFRRRWRTSVMGSYLLVNLSIVNITLITALTGPASQALTGRGSVVTTPNGAHNSNKSKRWFWGTTPPGSIQRHYYSLSVAAADSETTTATTTATSDTEPTSIGPSSTAALNSLTQDIISKMRFRELQRELIVRELPVEGTTSQMRNRLRRAVFPNFDEECIANEDGMGDDCNDEVSGMESFVQFIDQSDPDYEVEELVREVETKAEQGHWKAATRKLKKLSRRFPEYMLSEATYRKVLDSCTANRLQGARASEPTRKILEQMVEQGYGIPESAGNYCVKNCIGETGLMSTHQGFGGIDTALAMLGALELAGTPIQLDTYDKVTIALAKEGSLDDALGLIRRVVVERVQTPPLSTFADVATYATASGNNDEKVLSLLAYLKAAGYDLDNIASTQDGRIILACGVIAAERLDNIGLGLRILTAANKAKGVAPERGDNLVAKHSSAAQRACTLIHKRAINRAVENNEWKLAARLLELMLERNLRPNNWVWRSVVSCCAKAEKSRKATELLMEWVKLSERREKGDPYKPPLFLFNSVVNACEICDEHELTQVVLDAMKKTHSTEGNIITFNIALKRLAKMGNYRACEGIIVGMLQGGYEPNVVSYTTAIGACVSSEEKQPSLAYEWITRMRSRGVMPNTMTYNTAMAACVDGRLASCILAGKMANEMLQDANRQLHHTEQQFDEYTSVLPDSTTKDLARQLLVQLQSSCTAGEIDERVAKETIGAVLQQIVDFNKEQELTRIQNSQKAEV